MLSLKALDETFPIAAQMGVEASPVVLVNLFEVDASDEEALLRACEPPRESRRPVFQSHAAKAGASRDFQ